MTYVGHFPTARKRIRLTFMSTPSPDVYALLPSKGKAALFDERGPSLQNHSRPLRFSAWRRYHVRRDISSFNQGRLASLVRWRSSIRGRPFLGALTALMRLGFFYGQTCRSHWLFRAALPSSMKTQTTDWSLE